MIFSRGVIKLISFILTGFALSQFFLGISEAKNASDPKATTLTMTTPSEPRALLEDDLDRLRIRLLERRQAVLQKNLLGDATQNHVEVFLLADATAPLPQEIEIRWDQLSPLLIGYTDAKRKALQKAGANQLLTLKAASGTHSFWIRYKSSSGKTSELSIPVLKKGVPLILILKPGKSGRSLVLEHQLLEQNTPVTVGQRLGLWQHQAVFLYHQGKLDEAAGLFLFCLQTHPNPARRAEAAVWLSRVYLDWKSTGQAIRLLEQVLEQPSPETRVRDEAWYYLQKAHYRRKHYETVTALFSQEEHAAPPQARIELFYLAGQSFLRQKNYSKAIPAFNQVPRGSRFHPFALYGLGLAYLGFGDTFAAKESLQELIDDYDADDPLLKNLIDRSRLTLGLMMIEQNRYGEALNVLSALPSRSPLFDQALFGIGWSFLKSGEYVKAIVVFRDLMEIMPDSFYSYEAGLWTGFCYAELKAYARSVNSYREALQAASKQITAILRQMDQLRKEKVDLAELSRLPWLKQSEKNALEESFGKFQELSHLISQDGIQNGPETLRVNLEELSVRLDSSLKDYSLEILDERRRRLEDLSIQAALGIAVSLVLEKREFGREELILE